jgi:hypothetical protein
MLKIAVLAAVLAMVAATGSAAGRLDPYKPSRHIVTTDGRPVAGGRRGRRLRGGSEVVKYRAGGDPGLSLRSPPRQRHSRCWTSGYRALPKLNHKGHAIAIEHLKLRCGRVSLGGH